jgi:hypothetical protein
MPALKCGLFHTRLGRPIIVSKAQEGALIRANVWSTLGYTYIEEAADEPTYSDDMIAMYMIRNYTKVAMICRPACQERGSEYPFRIVNTVNAELNAWCKHFRAAAHCVREIHHCDVVLVPIADMQPEYYEHADECRISLLTVLSLVEFVPALSEMVV